MRLAIVAVLLALAPSAFAAPVVLELFTSESCSSCPPADALLTRLAAQPDILALSLHVDYWNRTGWRDRYSGIGATARQEAYARRLGADSVYTPELVVDGGRGVVGSDAQAVGDAIDAARAQPVASPALQARRDGDALRIVVGAGQGAAAVVLMGYDDRHVTLIGGGENTGRTLVESNVVRSMESVGDWTGAVLDRRVAWPAGQHAAVLLQRDDGRILAAAAVP